MISMGSFKSDWHMKDMHQSRVTFVADVLSELLTMEYSMWNLKPQQKWRSV